ncbi:N-acetylmuramoyl-L-alanine amidase [Flavobacterium sp. J49]|uniref:N-acetylmuramoyl-L-alanine amidase family protein n=1 Tax=Flavobacterium sp. J49 TaxID=2718534 RepID=UPI001594A7CD|nr:N-acetylmuramoyl-L-alanine amidase [Flavobacterium sp. J49]MBF6642376.1 N-acetylmuramoyl-L-alanine amidase [Flavobacterium sp. J49]NIC03622.1 N-acetylmuramoyl-L-alanine amidase [Flavobacterium sp. J49]
MGFQKNIKSYLSLLLLLSVLTVFGQGKTNKFVVVLDAGHGGKDPGNSYHGFVEKEIALKTTLIVGEILEKEKDFEVVYTRKNDTFIELVNRPKVANKINAHLFVSIHCNSVSNQTPSGTETFVMGLSRSDMNLEVAKSENSVILLEDNYNKTYKGFDPTKPESLIGRVMIQEENLNSSISLASAIQDNFTHNLNRKTRGVKQQPLWVLDAAVMPGVLIELGFLSNKEEGEFLNSEEGQNKMAKQIAKAILKYKREYFDGAMVKEETESPEDTIKRAEKSLVQTPVISKPEETQMTPVVEGSYKVQLFASSKKRELTSPDFKGLKMITYTFENNLYKYFYGNTTDLEGAKRMNEEAKRHGFKDAFIVTTMGGKTSAVKI